MRSFIGWTLLALVIPYGIYACFHPEHAFGLVALAVAGGIMLRRARNARAQPAVVPVPDLAVRIPPQSPVPQFDPVEVEADAAIAPEAAAAPPPKPQIPAFTPRGDRRDEIPPPPITKTGTVLKLVHSDGRRADVRDFRRRIAK